MKHGFVEGVFIPLIESNGIEECDQTSASPRIRAETADRMSPDSLLSFNEALWRRWAHIVKRARLPRMKGLERFKVFIEDEYLQIMQEIVSAEALKFKPKYPADHDGCERDRRGVRRRFASIHRRR